MKDVNYYRKMLHKDSIVLLVVAIIFAIINIILISGYENEAIPLFLKSILFSIFLIIIICNKKENKSFIGVLAIITGSLMMLTTIIGDTSLFGIVYFLLGLFYIIHSIIYLKKLKDYNMELNYSNEISAINSKIKYITLIPIFITIVLFILGFIFVEQPVGIPLIGIAILIINIANIIFCIILHHKNIKSALVYIMLIISIIISIFFGMFL